MKSIDVAAQLRAQIPTSTDPWCLEKAARLAELGRLPGRIQLRRTKGWRKPPGSIVCSRPSHHGNRYVIGQKIEHVDGKTVMVRDRTHALDLFREWLAWQMAQLPTMRDGIRWDLGARDLACWCALGEPCHVDVLLEVANS